MAVDLGEEGFPPAKKPWWPGGKGARIFADSDVLGWMELALREELADVEQLLMRRHEDLLMRLRRSLELPADDQPNGRSDPAAWKPQCKFLEEAADVVMDVEIDRANGAEFAPAATASPGIMQDSRFDSKEGASPMTTLKSVGSWLDPELLGSSVEPNGHSCPEHHYFWLSSQKKKTFGLGLDISSGVVICLNIVFMALHTEFRSYDLAVLLSHVPGMEESRSSSEVWPAGASVFVVFEWAFGIYFVIEWCLRVSILSTWRSWRHKEGFWNILDTFIIAAWLLNVLQGNSLRLNPTILRILRLARVLRLVKLIRHMQIFDPLHLIITSIQSTGPVLFWTVSILFLLLMVAATVLTSFLTGFIEDPTQDSQARFEIFRDWGSFTRAFVSMFEITLANWGPFCRRLMDHVDERWGFFFILWRCCVGFAVIQVISSIFIQTTFKVASRDEEIMVKEREKACKVYLRHLDRLYTNLDNDGDGRLTKEEFNVGLEQPRVKHYFGSLDIDVSDVPTLFQILDDGDGTISRKEFIEGLKRVRGAAQSLDLLALKKDVERLRASLD